MRVLLIDDDKAFRHLMEGMLSFGWPGSKIAHYDPAASGRPGPEFDLAQFDLVFLDYQLGADDGLEWLREFKSRASCPPTVMLTGQGNESVAVRAMKLGAADYLSKLEITNEALARIVQEAADSRRQESNSTLWQALPQVPQKRADLAVRIEGYRLVREVGQGAVSRVYLLNPEAGGAPVIAKVLLEELVRDEETMARFLKEHEIVGRIKSAHVARIFRYGFSDDGVYILMEYLSGGDVRTYFTDQVVDQGRILMIFRQLLVALRDIHSAGVVHRDLKPHNIMFRADGSVAMVDFGVAKVIDEPRVTQQGTLLGTPVYMSPEMILGRPVDARSDLYSAGIVLYKMLAKRAPFEGDSLDEIITQHVSAPVPPLPRSHEEFQPLIDALLAKNPDERPSSADGVLRFIDELYF